MFHIKFTSAAAFAAALVVCGTLRAQIMPSSAAQTLQGDLWEFMVFADGTPALLTSRAIYIADDNSLTNWTARAPLPVDYPISHVVGGSANRIYVVCRVNHHPSIRNLSVWTSEKGFESLRDIPMEGACSFVDDKKGVVALNPNMDVTIDGGKTWHKQNGIFPKDQHIDRVVWTAPDDLLLYGREGSLARFHMEKNGRLTKLWLIKIAGAFTVNKDQIWDTTPVGIEIRGIKDGAVITPAKGLKISTSGAFFLQAFGDIAYAATPENGDTGTAGHIDVFKFENKKFSLVGTKPNASANSMVVVGDAVFGMFMNAANSTTFLARLTPDAKAPEPLIITADNQAIVKADDETPGVATRAEVQEMLTLAKQLTSEEIGRVEKPVMAQKGLTNQQEVRLFIAGFKKLLAEKAAQSQPK